MNYRMILISISLSAALLTSNCSQSGGEKSSEETTAIPVEVTTVTLGSIESNLHFIGNVSAVKSANIFSKIPDHISKLMVDVGSAVHSGDTLAIIENEAIRQSVIQAEAGMENAEAQYKNILTEWKRIKKLYDDNAVSKSQYDAVNTQLEAARSGLKQMEAALKAARTRLNDTYIKAPFDGIIASRKVEEGDIASPQIPLFKLVSINEVKVEIEVIERELGLIKPGQLAHIEISSYPGRIFIGKVFRVYPTLNPLTRTAKVEIKVQNKDLLLKPGMFASVDIIIDSRDSVPIIPKDAILLNTQLRYDQQGISTDEVYIRKFVYIVKNDIARKKEIETGIETENEIEVTKGLSPGDTIVTLGIQNLSDSTVVRIIKKG